MNIRVNAIKSALLASFMVAAGCANTGTKVSAPQATAEAVSDSWITTKLKGEQVKGVSGVVTADSTALLAEERRDQSDPQVRQAQSDTPFDSDAEFGRRSLPFFPVFAIRPW